LLADGKTYQSVVIDRKTFKWMLATIDTKRIWNKEARSRIERFQAEAIDVIDAAFNENSNLP
jgi:hypothetical protein